MLGDFTLGDFMLGGFSSLFSTSLEPFPFSSLSLSFEGTDEEARRKASIVVTFRNESYDFLCEIALLGDELLGDCRFDRSQRTKSIPSMIRAMHVNTVRTREEEMRTQAKRRNPSKMGWMTWMKSFWIRIGRVPKKERREVVKPNRFNSPQVPFSRKFRELLSWSIWRKL
jgi:hypothetical protein